MPRPKRAKIVTTRATAWVNDGPEGINASTETILAGSNPQWPRGPSHTLVRNDHSKLEVSSADLDTSYPESDLLKSVKEKMRKEDERREKKFEAEKNQSLRTSGRTASKIVEPNLLDVMRQQTVLEDDTSSLTNQTTQTVFENLFQPVKDTIQNVASDIRRRVSTRSRRTREGDFIKDTTRAGQASTLVICPDEDSGETQSAVSNRLQPTPVHISLANFKRRPRQPSLLQMVQQSMVDEDKTVMNDVDDEHVDVDSVLAGLQRSSPTHEHGGSHGSTMTPTMTSSASRKRKASVLDSPIISSPLSQVLDLEHLPSDPAELARDRSSPLPMTAREVSISNQMSTVVKHTHKSLHTPTRIKHTNAHKRELLREKLSSPLLSATSPVSSPLSSAPNPVAIAPRAVPVHKETKPVHITTASLQALLPRRRQPKHSTKRDTFDIPSDDTTITPDGAYEGEDDDDIDELQRPTRRRIAKGTKNAPPPAKKVNIKAKKILSKSSSKTTNANAKITASTGARTKRTYGSLEEHRENDNWDDEDNEIEEAPVGDEDIDITAMEEGRKIPKSKEMIEAKKKFKAVDEWELDFESCNVTGGSSSPWR